jgi:hypothetical protein
MDVSKEHVSAKSFEELADAVRFTMQDHQRLLRQKDVEDICPSQDLCFEYSDTVRCGPCAIRQAAKSGVETDHELPFAPEQYRLQRKLKSTEGDVINLQEALRELIAACAEHCGEPSLIAKKIEANGDRYLDLLGEKVAANQIDDFKLVPVATPSIIQLHSNPFPPKKSSKRTHALFSIFPKSL